MDAHSFDRWTVALAQRPSRRATVRLLTAGLLGGLLARNSIAPVRAQRPDSDNDGLFDDDELRPPAEGGYGTNPNMADTDGDLAGDGQEIFNRDNGLGDPDDPLVQDNPAAPPPPDMAPPPATCIALGGACGGMDQPCCGNDPAAFGYNNVICCPTANGSACTDVAGTFLCPDPGVPDAGCPGRTIDCGGGVCIDLQLDHGNCGFCGNACPFGSNCCAGACIDVMNDPFNCGWCGRICEGADAYCEVGVCKVFPPLPDPLF